MLVPVSGIITAAALVLACTQETTKKPHEVVDYGSDFYNQTPVPDEPSINPNAVNTDSGAFGAASERPAPDLDGGGPTIAPPKQDAGSSSGGTTTSGGPVTTTYCGVDGTITTGDLAIVEMMIASQSGSGDTGEWIEIQNTHADCSLKLKGLSVQSPRGAATPNTATFVDDIDLPPNGTFVVVGSSDPTLNHGITGTMISWEASDVLKNDGDTLTVSMGQTQIDTLTYPAFSNLTPGRALSFPSDCAWSDRSSWERWSLTYTEYATGFKGTPNAENTDVVCF